MSWAVIRDTERTQEHQGNECQNDYSLFLEDLIYNCETRQLNVQRQRCLRSELCDAHRSSSVNDVYSLLC